MLSAPLIFYISLFLVGALGTLGYMWTRGRRTLDPPLPSRSSQGAPEPGDRRKPTTGRHSGLSVSTESVSALKEAELLVSSKRSRDRKCPKCERIFHESLVICPHDQTPLKALEENQKRVVVRESSDCPTCRQCGRRFEHGIRYCRHDGNELALDVEKALCVYVCRNCGSESETPPEKCCEEPNVVEVNPSVVDQRPPLIPMLFCPLCHHVEPNGAAMQCPNDLVPLLPMLHLARTRLAPLGEGPRRTICPHCSKRYSKAAVFCAFDGHKLLPLD